MTIDDNQSKRREYESYKPEETALTIAKPIPHIVNNKIEVKPEDVILSYAEILNNPKNLTYTNISKIERNFISIDAKTDNEKLLLKNSLEYLEFLKTSSSPTDDLFCIDFSKENILKKTWASKKIALETEASPRSENPPYDFGDRGGGKISNSPRNQTQSNSIFRIVREEEVKKDNIDPSKKNGIEKKVIIQSEKPEMKTFEKLENSLLRVVPVKTMDIPDELSRPTRPQTPVKTMDISDELSPSPRLQTPFEASVDYIESLPLLSPYSQIQTPESKKNGAQPTIVASLGYVTSPNSRNDNSGQLTPSPETTQRASFKEGAPNSTGCASRIFSFILGK